MDAVTSPPAPRARPGHHGVPRELFAIFLVNIALTIVTLGVYRFWARTRIRTYLWSQTSFLDDRLEYTGTGKELFLGFLIAFAFIAALSVAYQAAFLTVMSSRPDLGWLLQVAGLVGIVFLVGVALYRARRYRLSRTLWRGIRGAQTGSALEYALRRLFYLFLSFISLGLYLPFMNTRLTGFRLNNTWFGDRRFRFDGDGRDLLKRFVVCWLLFVPTLGLSWFWYRAAALRYFAEHTAYENLRFATDVRGRPLMWLMVSNMLLTVVTLGLAYPYVLIRNARFICANLDIVGEQDFSLIAQSRAPLPGTGEGLAATLDVGEF